MKQKKSFNPVAAKGSLSEVLWLQYLEALGRTITIQGAAQVTFPYVIWNWGEKSKTPGLTYDQFQYLDRVPETPVADYQSFGAKQGFGDQYSLFLQSIDDIPSEKNKAYEALLQAQDDAIGALGTVESEITAAFQNYLDAGGEETRTVWLNNEGSSYKLRLATAKDAVQQATRRVNAFRQALAGPIRNALEKYQENQVNIPNPLNPQKPLQVPGWGTSATPYNHVLDITGDNFGGKATKGAAGSFGITAASSKYDYEKVYGEGEAGLETDFFGIRLEGSYEKVDMSSFSSEYSITFQFQDLASIAVNPGAWWTGGIVGTYQNGPYFPFRPTGFDKGGGKPYFFGNGGLLARQINSLIVGYRPSVIVDGGETFATSVKEAIKGSGALRVGPFTVGGGGGSIDSSGSVTFDGAQITIEAAGDWPYIVAVNSGYTVDPPTS